MIRITSKKADRFFRCGIGHTKTPAEYPDDRFTAAELAILKAEAMLIVEAVPAPAKADTAGAPDIASLTVEQLKAEIAKFHTGDTLPQGVPLIKGMKKADLVEILTAHREATTAKG